MTLIVRPLADSRIAGALLLASIMIGIAACGAGPAAPSSTRTAAIGEVAASSNSRSSAAQPRAGQTKADICHRDDGADAFTLISVATPAVDAHLAHGDVRVGDPMPGMPGMVAGADCAPVPAGPVTITFAGLLVNGAPVSSYAESGFVVASIAGNWQALTTYGHPAPFIQFVAPAGAPPTTGTIQVTAGGSPFRHASVDLYSSTTAIPYVMTGLRNSMTVFTVAGTQPQTFGNFATVANPHAADVIDTLSIALTNSPAVCCANPMGLDNIVLIR